MIKEPLSDYPSFKLVFKIYFDLTKKEEKCMPKKNTNLPKRINKNKWILT